MQLNRFKLKKAALILFGAAFVLLAANLVNSKLQETEQIITKRVLKNSETDSLFYLSLRNLGLMEESIIKNSNEYPYQYKIKVPIDLSIPVVLSEINRVFDGTQIKIVSDEKSLNGLTNLEISSEEKIILKARLNYDDKIKRVKGNIAFVIEDFELSETEDSLLLDIPEPFTILILPQSENIDLAKFIISKKKTYSILLNDDISELKYKLNESYSTSRLSGPFSSIIEDFRNASQIFIDQNSGIYNSKVLNFIEKELLKRNINLYKLNELTTIDFSNDEELINGFDEIMMKISNEEKTVIRIGPEGFRSLLEEIKRYKKLGYKIVHPTELM